MSVEIYSLDFNQFRDRVTAPEALSAAKLSSDLIVAMYNSRPLCFLGLIPKTMISDSAYIWMITTLHGYTHSLIIARHAKEMLGQLQTKYSVLFGHCFEVKSKRWLKSLGAEFVAANVFELRRK